MKKKNKYNKDSELISGISTVSNKGMPESPFEMVNFYGTYEIQATAETDNMYPTIAQGYNPKIKSRDCENPIPPKYPKRK